MDSVKLTLEVPMEVFFDFQKREAPTRHCPGCEAQFEVNSISINGIEVGPGLFKMLMEKYQENILERCQNEMEGNL